MILQKRHTPDMLSKACQISHILNFSKVIKGHFERDQMCILFLAQSTSIQVYSNRRFGRLSFENDERNYRRRDIGDVRYFHNIEKLRPRHGE